MMLEQTIHVYSNSCGKWCTDLQATGYSTEEEDVISWYC